SINLWKSERSVANSSFRLVKFVRSVASSSCMLAIAAPWSTWSGGAVEEVAGGIGDVGPGM
ncbi:hypothetical protein A2U01_0060921, partial [Trifolium medium]|nr:hypothetical protein [Trifolium medium]